MNRLITIYLFDKKQNSNLVLLALLSLTLLLLRVKFTQEIYLLFLIWNLFLGYIPYFLSSKIKTTIPGTFIFYVMLLGWLLFLPNAFYLITDFVHLHHVNRVQFAFDFIVLSSFTVAGFYSGILSLFDIHFLLQMKYTTKISRLLIISIIYLSAFGIYLGRILRFNSWDILYNPIELFCSILDSISYVETNLFTIILGTFILIIYHLSYSFINKKTI